VSKKSQKQLARTCSAHATTQMDFFCKTDKSYLCGKCLISGEHLGHDIVHVDDEVNVYRRKIVNSIKALDEKYSMISDNKEKFEKSLGEYQKLTKDTLIDLDQRFNEVLNLVAKRREELIENFMKSTSSINEYLKDKVQYFGKVQENIKHCVLQQKDKKKKLDNLNGLDLRSVEPLNEEEVMDKIYENLNEKFNYFGGEKERDLNQIFDFLASVQLNFSQSPFFVFKEDLLKDFLENYAQIVSFNFGLKNEFQIENTLLFENKGACSTFDDHSWLNEKNFQKPVLPSLVEVDSHPQAGQNKENIPEQPGLITMDSMKIEEPEVGVEDPFADFRTSGITLCLTGQNNKALYMNEKGESELASLEFEFARPEDSKAIVFKNFASCTMIERNKVIYTGGGPSNEAFLVEFKSKKKAHITCLPKMNFKRCWHGVVYVRPYVYVIGGYDGGSRLRECERLLNLQDNTHGTNFEAIAPLNEARSLFGYTLTKNNVIYVVGGVTASKKFGCTDSIERYSILENKWSLLQVRLPQKLCGLSCLTFEDENENEEKMIIFGGSDNLNRSVKSVFELNLIQGKINEFDQMMSKRQMNNKAFEKHGIIYLIGGGTDCDCEIWNLNNNSKTTFHYGDHLKSDLKNFCAFTA